MVRIIYDSNTGEPVRASVFADNLEEAEKLLRKSLTQNAIRKEFLYNNKVNDEYQFFLD